MSKDKAPERPERVFVSFYNGGSVQYVYEHMPVHAGCEEYVRCTSERLQQLEASSRKLEEMLPRFAMLERVAELNVQMAYLTSVQCAIDQTHGGPDERVLKYKELVMELDSLLSSLRSGGEK
jgi:hypothetical protein